MEIKYIFLLLLSCIISAFSQILLKKSSQKKYSSFVFQYFNLYVLIGYLLFLLVLIINIYLLQFLPISITNALCESIPLLLSLFSGLLFFGEKITKKKLISCIIIIAGICILVI